VDVFSLGHGGVVGGTPAENASGQSASPTKYLKNAGAERASRVDSGLPESQNPHAEDCRCGTSHVGRDFLDGLFPRV